jgi:hypothetical protein
MRRSKPFRPVARALPGDSQSVGPGVQVPVAPLDRPRRRRAARTAPILFTETTVLGQPTIPGEFYCLNRAFSELLSRGTQESPLVELHGGRTHASRWTERIFNGVPVRRLASRHPIRAL